jgi:putative MATE family efflux protein
LAAVAIGTAAFTASFWIFSFLAYGVTPQVARALGKGDTRGAADVGVQAIAVALAAGSLVMIVGLLFAPQIVRLLGGSEEVGSLAVPYLRIRVLSAVAVLIAQVGHGWLRGAHGTKTAMYIAVTGATANIVLDYVLIYPAGMGVAGAAWATVIAQTGTAAAFLWVLRPRLSPARRRVDMGTMRRLLTVGRDLIVRTGSLLAAMTFAVSLAARMGITELGAWQIAMQLFLFLSLLLDSVAIAAQALIAERLGAADREGARAISRRLMELGLGLGVVLGAPIILLRGPTAGLFTGDAEVVAAATGLLLWLGLVQPIAALAFTLDGIFIGALRTRMLALSMVVASALYAGSAYAFYRAEWGTAGLTAAATIWLGARVAITGYFFLERSWIEAGSASASSTEALS